MSRRRFTSTILAMGLASGVSLSLAYAQDARKPAVAGSPQLPQIVDTQIKRVQELPVIQPELGAQSAQSTTAPAASTPVPTVQPTVQAAIGGAELQREAGSATSAISAGVQGGQVTQNLATSDAGDLLSKSVSAVGVETQKRSPIANESRVRGYKLGQLLTSADGVFWFPARQDLDTFLSKIDSGSIKNALVIKGPYSARLGPGFSFIDITTEGVPYTAKGEGFQFHGRTSYTYKTNGEQMYGRQMLSVGDESWGFKASYGHRTGNDYDAGDGRSIPSSYNVRDIDTVFGYKLSENNEIELGYLRLDQTGLEFPGQVFDTNFLITNGYRGRFSSKDQDYFDLFIFEGYYNRSSMEGDSIQPGKKRIIDLENLLGFRGFTNIDQASGGYRTLLTWGREREPQYTIGTDFRRLAGALNEQDTVFFLPCANVVNFPVLPSQQSTVGGLFAEHDRPINENLNLKLGGRVDWVSMNTTGQPNPPLSCISLAQTLLRFDDFERDFTLAMAFGTAEYKINDQLSITSGLGTAQRPPTQTELYAAGPFLATLQQGLTTVLGNPNLNPERTYQIDLGIRGNYENVRFGLSGFYAYIEDYITFQPLPAGAGFVKFQGLTGPIGDALTVRFINTNLATLSGFEAYADTDFTDWLTPFVVASLVEGRDQTLGSGYVLDYVPPTPPQNGGPGSPATGTNQKNLPPQPVTGNKQEPLPSIAPLDTRLGLRFHEITTRDRAPRYGVELTARVAARQDRVATSLQELNSAGFTIWDLRGFWKVSDRLLFTSGVENLFNRNYREHLDLRTGGLGVYQPGANGYFGIELRY